MFKAVVWGPWGAGAKAAAEAMRVARMESFMFDICTVLDVDD